MFETVLYSSRAGIATIVLNRPEKLNAFNDVMQRELIEALDVAKADNDVRVVILKGAGRAFSSGYDIDPSSGYGEKKDAGVDRARLEASISRWLYVWDFPKPVIAQIHGYCIAGATMLAICTDLTIVSDDCKIRWPSLPIGGGLISPMWTWLVGPKKAKEMSFIAGSEMSGAEAFHWGWANYAVPADALEAKVMDLAQRIAKTPLDLLQIKKRAVNRVMDLQGFRTAALYGAEWDAVAHFSDGAQQMLKKVREVGVKEAAKWMDAKMHTSDANE